MKPKRIAILLLCLLLSLATGASASLASLETALDPLLEGRGAVSLSAGLTVVTLLPFDETRIDLINRVLQHAALNARIETDGDDTVTEFQLSLGDTTLMEISEQCQSGAYLLQTSLLENRILFSTQASPMDTLLACEEEEETEDTETTLNTSDVETAFDFQAASAALEDCYRTLIDQTVPLTEKNTPNYSIENIGRGRISYVAKLTKDQSTELLNELRTVLSCGMNAEYQAEIAEMTFASGFVVALYQNEDAEDICVYIKGTVIYPDGDKRTLKWQWAFTPDRGIQTFTFEAARESGTRDSRVVSAILTRTEDGTAWTMEEETTVNLRRSSLNETSTLTVDLQGDNGEPATCAGSIARVTSGTSGGEDTGETEMDITVDLALTATEDGAELSGTAVYQTVKDDIVQAELAIAFTPTAATAAAEAEESAAAAPGVIISIIPADPATAEETAETPTSTAEETQTEQSEFLVGTPPLGLYDYEIPADVTTINMDNAERKVHQSLLNEAAQQLAGHLVLAILDLPTEDRELLSDGMTEADYAIFLAMLD